MCEGCRDGSPNTKFQGQVTNKKLEKYVNRKGLAHRYDVTEARTLSGLEIEGIRPRLHRKMRVA